MKLNQLSLAIRMGLIMQGGRFETMWSKPLMSVALIQRATA